MNKYPGIILAVAAALMITSCSSVFSGKDPRNAAAKIKEETPVMRIENETEPEKKSDVKADSQGKQDEAEEAGKDKNITAIQKNMYAISRVHVRSDDSADSASLAMIDKGQRVSVTGESDNGWMRVDYSGKKGYVSKAYLSDTKPEEGSLGLTQASDGIEGNRENSGFPSGKSTKAGTGASAPVRSPGVGTKGTGTTGTKTPVAGTEAGSSQGLGAAGDSGGDGGVKVPTVEASPFTSKPASDAGKAGGPDTVVRPKGANGSGTKPNSQVGPGV